jgi:hypothetical protein
MYSLCWGDHRVQVSSNLVPHSSRIKVEKKELNFEKFLGGPDISGTSTRQIRSLVLFGQTNLILFLNISGETRHIRFKGRHVYQTFSAAMLNDYFNCKSNWSHSSSVGIKILLGSFFCYWKVVSSPYSIEVAWGFNFGTYADSCKEFYSTSVHPSPVASSVLQK